MQSVIIHVKRDLWWLSDGSKISATNQRRETQKFRSFFPSLILDCAFHRTVKRRCFLKATSLNSASFQPARCERKKPNEEGRCWQKPKTKSFYLSRNKQDLSKTPAAKAASLFINLSAAKRWWHWQISKATNSKCESRSVLNHEMFCFVVRMCLLGK